MKRRLCMIDICAARVCIVNITNVKLPCMIPFIPTCSRVPHMRIHIFALQPLPPHSMPFFQIFFALFSHYLRNRLGKFIQCSNEGETKKNRNTGTHTSSGMKRKRPPSSSMLTISSKTNMHFIDTVTIFERMNEI